MVSLEDLVSRDTSFRDIYELWNSRRGDGTIPNYNDIHLEDLEAHVTNLTVFDFKNPQEVIWSFLGAATRQFLRADMIGRNLFDHVHQDDLEPVRDFYTYVATTPGIGQITYVAHLQGGLVAKRAGFALPCSAPDPDVTKVLVLTLSEGPGITHLQSEEPVLYNVTADETFLFPLT